MQHFHMNVFTDLDAMDVEGLDLPDLDAAKGMATAGAREMIAADICVGKSVHQSHRVEITDHAGVVLHTVRFGDMVRLEP